MYVHELEMAITAPSILVNASGSKEASFPVPSFWANAVPQMTALQIATSIIDQVPVDHCDAISRNSNGFSLMLDTGHRQ
jgi:hypothetical protein